MAFFEHYGTESDHMFHHFNLTRTEFPLHFHKAFELIIVRQGKLHLAIDDHAYTLLPNECAFIFSHQLHGFHAEQHTEMSILIFSPELIGDFAMDYQHLIPDQPIFTWSESWPLEEITTHYQQKSLLYAICDRLISQSTFSNVHSSTKKQVLLQLFSYIDQHYTTTCTLKGASQSLQYDYAYLSKLFSQFTQMPFTHYVNYYRIAHARYLLKNTSLSVGQIADQCGYQTLRSFHRNFKKITQQSPKAYRTHIV
ncbi:AraC-like ligand binding domain-containing protein [Pelagirhabdus alkalitolerans]|uniref:AraC-like ligand binding domain-containing protein n=1 Tax=Pelagirhabdus alkalitolerans TaxID=1612202 RepID=A0A1G6JW86_9BACI|nr:helix-turn-helix domain-containing protein [Pelagirhabdus alkalitolerans]SDC22918.1 AraC-like ligand binding domain-containing protein [Pelagirhabdus alkalitolerans]